MPTRNQLHKILVDITDSPYAQCIPLGKPNYSNHEANQIQLQTLISFHSLLLVDYVLCKLNASPTNININTLYDYLRDGYQQRTEPQPYQKDTFMRMFNKTKGRTTIGRVQAISLLLECIKEAYDVTVVD